jgi:hypothetical protein
MSAQKMISGSRHTHANAVHDRIIGLTIIFVENCICLCCSSFDQRLCSQLVDYGKELFRKSIDDGKYISDQCEVTLGETFGGMFEPLTLNKSASHHERINADAHGALV